MSHYFGIVLINPGDGPDAVAKLLAPWNENTAYDEDRHDGWWDWYSLGGRWDGKVRGIDGYAECPVCGPERTDLGLRMTPATIDCSYGPRHRQWARNVIPVSEIGEVLPFTVVKPDGSFTHRAGYDGPWSDDDDAPWPNYVEKPDAEWQREVAEIMLAHRHCVAVGIDYHS